MNKKVYRSIALLFIAVLSTAAVIAQPRHHDDDNDRRNENYHDRRYDDDHDMDYKGNGGKDYDGTYYNRNFNDRDYRQYKVRHRPSVPYYMESRRPSPNHIWIDGDWVISHGQYTYRPGYWMIQNRGQAFVPGHWERVHRGWYWVPGYWTRINRHW